MPERCGYVGSLRLALIANWHVNLLALTSRLRRRSEEEFAMDRAIALIASVRDVAPDVRAFRLVLENERAIPFEPGGHLDVEELVAGQRQTRSYSMLQLGAEPGWAIAVKHPAYGR